MGADLDKLANLVRICGFLMQTKAYLFWKKEDLEWDLIESFVSVLSGQSYCKRGQSHEDCKNRV